MTDAPPATGSPPATAAATDQLTLTIGGATTSVPLTGGCQPFATDCQDTDLPIIDARAGATISIRWHDDPWYLVRGTLVSPASPAGEYFDIQRTSPVDGFLPLSMLAAQDEYVLRLWLGRGVAPDPAVEVSPTGYAAVRLRFHSDAITLGEAAATDTLAAASGEPGDLPGKLIVYSVESNELRAVDRSSGRSTLLTGLEGPLDPQVDGFCADGCGASSLLWNGDSTDLWYLGAGPGVGESWHVDPTAKTPPARDEFGEASAAVALSSDSRFLAVNRFDRLEVFDSSGHETSYSVQAAGSWSTVAAAFSPDDRTLFVANGAAIWAVVLDSTTAPRLLARADPLGPSVTGLEAMADGRLVVSMTTYGNSGGVAGPTTLRVLDPAFPTTVTAVYTTEPGTRLLDADRSGRFFILGVWSAGYTDGILSWTDLATVGPLAPGTDATW